MACLSQSLPFVAQVLLPPVTKLQNMLIKHSESSWWTIFQTYFLLKKYSKMFNIAMSSSATKDKKWHKHFWEWSQGDWRNKKTLLNSGPFDSETLELLWNVFVRKMNIGKSTNRTKYFRRMSHINHGITEIKGTINDILLWSLFTIMRHWFCRIM